MQNNSEDIQQREVCFKDGVTRQTIVVQHRCVALFTALFLAGLFTERIRVRRNRRCHEHLCRAHKGYKNNRPACAERSSFDIRQNKFP